MSTLLVRHAIFALDIYVFLMKAIGEYIRLAYRSFKPRPLRDVAGIHDTWHVRVKCDTLFHRRGGPGHGGGTRHRQGGGAAAGQAGGHRNLCGQEH